jgi:DNA mismatch repair protein MutL
MSRIRQLPDRLVNLIAAGEVVERPASVLKELLENAIDAGAATVTVDLRDAGRQLIRVADDGIGMTPEELPLALERHATSKISTERDLDTIHTLGFRGEALPSICAVSRFTIASVPAGSTRGKLVRGEAGQIIDRLDVDAPAGTTVEVRDLFFNTPARLRFLKSPQWELAAALRIAQQLALAHPGVHLRVTHNSRSVLSAPRAATLRDRVGNLLGHDRAGQLLALESTDHGVSLEGLVSPPQVTRGNRDGITIIVNGRPVRDALIVDTLLEAYRPLLPRDQFPVGVLRLTLAPEEVDVNVHPSKAWVKFRRSRLVQETVFREVQRVLRSPEVVRPTPLPGAPPRGAPVAAEAPAAESQPALFNEAATSYAASRFGSVVGQIQDTFVVSATDEEVFFVDQHVAHERVIFERVKAELSAGPLPSQELLFAEPIDLEPASRVLLSQWLPALTRLGFAVEEFGRGSFLLRAVPALLRGEEPRRLIEGLLKDVGPTGSSDTPEIDRALAFVACRAAVKANQPLDRGEMARLLEDLSATETPYFCPHGRPITSRLSLKEIKRELRRTW